MKYFIGNWKMFGVPKSRNIADKINFFITRDKNRNKYEAIITPPYTLLENFVKHFKKRKLKIGSQNCYQKDLYSSNTAAISPYMLKKVGVTHTIIGHSDNRAEGDTDLILNNKVKFASKNKLKIIFCIGENKIQKKKKQTFQVLKNQLVRILSKKNTNNNIIVAYEPIWSIGTGQIPKQAELIKTIHFIKRVLRSIFKKNKPIVLYGGSVDESNINLLKQIHEIDGFLIGGASKSPKKFIDIIKNYYR